MEGRILLTSLKDILENIALDEIVYALHLKEYRIQPLFYNKIGIEPNIGENLSATDTLREIAG